MKKIAKELWKEMNIIEKFLIALICILSTILLIATFAGCSVLENYQDDNFVEEYFEEVIKGESGYDIDFSPFSRE